jgi:predicted peroxiredoxin
MKSVRLRHRNSKKVWGLRAAAVTGGVAGAYCPPTVRVRKTKQTPVLECAEAVDVATFHAKP